MELKVVKEGQPDRCEICHKVDLFDPQLAICQRCKDLPTRLRSLKPSESDKEPNAIMIVVMMVVILMMLAILVAVVSQIHFSRY